MADQEIHYEIVCEDEHGFDPLGCSYGTREEAEQDLKNYLPCYPGAFIVRVTFSRLKPNQVQHLTAV